MVFPASKGCDGGTCKVVNPIKDGNFAFLFNITPAGRTSDPMTFPIFPLVSWVRYGT